MSCWVLIGICLGPVIAFKAGVFLVRSDDELFATKNKGLTQEFCLIANICAAEWAIPVQQDNGHNYKSLQTEPLSSLSDKMSKNVIIQ